MHHFQMPLCKYRGATEERRYLDLSATTVCYSLIAVVRLREKDSDTDFVRIYSTGGACILPAYESKSFMKSSWSLEDSNTAEYMLFFGWSGLDTPDMGYPEAGAPEPYDPEVDRINELLCKEEGEKVQGDVLDGDMLPHGTSQQQSPAISNIAPIAEGDGAAPKSQRNSKNTMSVEPSVKDSQLNLPVTTKTNIHPKTRDGRDIASKGDDSGFRQSALVQVKIEPTAEDGIDNKFPAERRQLPDDRTFRYGPKPGQRSGSRRKPMLSLEPKWRKFFADLPREDFGPGARQPKGNQLARTQQPKSSRYRVRGRGGSQPRGSRYTHPSGRGDRSSEPFDQYAARWFRENTVGSGIHTHQHSEQQRAGEPQFSTLAERSRSRRRNRSSHDRDQDTRRRSRSRDYGRPDVSRQGRQRTRSRSPSPRASDRHSRRRSRSPRNGDRQGRRRSRSPRARDRQSEQPDLYRASRHEGNREHRSTRSPHNQDRRNC